MRQLTWVAAMTLMFAALGGCDLFTGPDDRFIGIIGHDTAADSEAGLYAPSGVTRDGAFNRVAADTTRLRCPDHPHSYDERCATVDAPDTVQAGASFSVTVRTVGRGGCVFPDGVEVSESSMMLEVVPYDRKTGPNCAGESTLPRSVELVFPDPGDGLLRITGRILIVGDSVGERMGSVDRPIVVR